MAFHRLTTPSYFGGLPGGYDYINNAISGTPAAADGPKAVGPNVGTYFIAFGEDGTSSDANRPAKALAQNTDALDDLFHRDIAIKKVTADVTVVGSPVTSIVLSDPNGIYCGRAGTANNAVGINTFIEILDSNNNEIIGTPASGARSVVTAISGATVGTGFNAGPITLTVSPGIPVGVTYRVYYAVRGNLASLPADEFTDIVLRAAQERDYLTIDFENQISKRTGIDVTALIASKISTPDGVRRPEATSMILNPDQLNTFPTSLRRVRAWAGDAVTPSLHIADLAGTTNPDSFGLIRYLAFGSVNSAGVGQTADGSGTLQFWDQNMRNVEVPGLLGRLPLSGTVKGEDYPLVSDQRTFLPLIRHLNKAEVVVGNGTTTFGQFDGVDGLSKAWNAWNGGYSPGSLHIRLKAGTYNLSALASIIVGNDRMTLTIEGESQETVIITNNVSGNAGLRVNSGRLILKNLTIQKGTGDYRAVSVTSSGNPAALELHNVQLSLQRIELTNPNPQGLLPGNTLPSTITTGPTLIINDSIIDMYTASGTAGTLPCISLLVGDNLEHYDFIIRRTAFRPAQDNTAFKVTATSSGISTTRVRNIIFRECQFYLSWTSDDGAGGLLTNVGPIWLDPLDSVNALQVDNIVFKDCDVYGNWHQQAASVGTLLHLYAPAHNYNGTSHPGKTSIGRVTIDGGTWVMASGVTTGFIPFVVNAQTLRVRNLDIQQTDSLTGIIPANLAAYYGSSSASVWAAVNFLSKLESAAQTAFELFRTFEIQNVSLRNVRRTQCSTSNGYGDLRISSPTTGYTLVRDVRVHQMNNTVIGSLGFYADTRVQVLCGEASAASPIRNVVWDSNGLSSSSPWANTCLMTLSGGAGATFEDCGARGLTGAGTTYGIMLSGAGNVRLVNCFGENCQDGLYLNPSGSPDYVVQGGSYSGNNRYGISFLPAASTYFFVSIIGVQASNNGDVGLYVFGPASAWSPLDVGGWSSSLHATDNVFEFNNTSHSPSVVQTFIGISDAPGITGFSGTFMGNTLNHADPGAVVVNDPGHAQFLVNGAASSYGFLSRMIGAQSLGPADVWGPYATNGNRMPLNRAVLHNGP